MKSLFSDMKLIVFCLITLATLFLLMFAGAMGFKYWWPCIWIVGITWVVVVFWMDRHKKSKPPS